MKKYDESLTKQKAFALTANAATLLRLQRLIFLRIFSHWSQPKVASHTLRAAQPPDFFIYYMSKKIENKQKKHKKKDRQNCLSYPPFVTPARRISLPHGWHQQYQQYQAEFDIPLVQLHMFHRVYMEYTNSHRDNNPP